ncbi:hypothetical protein Bbelb_254430 [Branchiostoma belcheri]|nr:hypothetical protein Bbelb_254430 [Branchiostoma belcheri]
MPRPYWSPNLFTTPTVFEKLAKEDNAPQTVILHVGTNDVMAKPKDTIISDFEMTVSTTQSLFPDTEIVVSAVPPRRDSSYRPHANADIAEINTHLQNLCSSNEQLTYVNHPQLWSNNDYCPNFYESDGYHLNGDGVRIIASNLKKQATSALGLPPRKHNRSPRRQSYKRPGTHDISPPSYTKGRNEGRNTQERLTSKISWRIRVALNRPKLLKVTPQNQFSREHEWDPPRRDRTSRQDVKQTGQSHPSPTTLPKPPESPTATTMAPGMALPLEAYGGPPRNTGRPPWLEPPPFPFYNMGSSWYGRFPGSSFGFNERPRGFN